MQTPINRATSQVETASARRIEVAVLYGALALIGAVVFGTLSIHPF